MSRLGQSFRLACLLSLAVAWVTSAEAQQYGQFVGFEGLTSLRMPKIDEGSDIRVTADRMGADNENQLATLDGNVVVHFSDITVRCDRATYKAETGDIHAEGNVSIHSASGGSWEGDSIDFNHRTGEGLIGTGILHLSGFAVQADSVARDDDGIIHAKNATVTTCTNEPSAWHWAIKGQVRAKDREFVEMRNATGYLFGVPILWFPYYYRDLNTDYGWRFLPGYTGKWGAFLKTGYVYPIAGSADRQSLLYGKSVLDLRSEYGVGVGQEFTWSSVSESGISQNGRFAVYYANHHEDQKFEDSNWSSSYDTHRYTIGFQQHFGFSPRDFLFIKGEYLSDSDFRTDYNELAVRSSAQPQSIINYEHRENTWVTSLAAAGPLNVFYAGVRRLPEFRLDTLPQPVFGLDRLTYESQTSMGYFHRQPAKIDSATSDRYSWQTGNWAYYDTFRLDTRHVIRRPFTLAEGITFTPRLGWRGTYYTDSPVSGSLFRSLFELGATLQARYWKDYESFRHSFTPYLNFTYVPGSEYDAEDQPYAFDYRDMEYEWRDRFNADGLTPTHRYTGLRFGVRNLLQKRAPKSLSEWLNLDLYGVHVFKTQDHWVRWTHRQQPGRETYTRRARRYEEETGFRVVGLDGSWKPFRNLTISSDVQYDPEKSNLAFFDINAKLKVSALTLYVGYLYRDHDVYDTYWYDVVQDSVFYGGLIHHICDMFDWSGYIRYNTERSELEEIGGYIQYNLDCISFRIITDYIPAYYSEDRVRHGSDFRLAFSMSLRAFPQQEDEDWMMWGNLSNNEMLDSAEEQQ